MEAASYSTKDSTIFDNDGDGSASTRGPGTAVPFQRYIPRMFLFDRYRAPVEASGLAFNAFARGAVAMSTLFLGPALLKLARAQAEAACGQEYDDAECGEGGGRVYGMRPTSLLTNIGVFSGLLSSAVMPLVGSIV